MSFPWGSIYGGVSQWSFICVFSKIKMNETERCSRFRCDLRHRYGLNYVRTFKKFLLSRLRCGDFLYFGQLGLKLDLAGP